MKKSKILLLCLFLIILFPTLQSQDKVTYRYDAAGNRISRTISISPRSTAVEEDEEEQLDVYSEIFSDITLKIYPNPTTGLLKVEIYNLPEYQMATIWLYSMSGQLITNINNVSNNADIDISGQPAGVYVMRIIAGEFQTEWKIIKL